MSGTGSSVGSCCAGGRKRRRAFLLAGLAFATAACAGEGGPPETEAPTLPEFALEETLRLDGYALELSPIPTSYGVVVARDGTIGLAQPQELNVKFFDSEGRFIRAFGNRGQGPGEFTNLRRMGWMGGDTLYIYDASQLRFTLLDPELNYVRYVHSPSQAHPSEALRDSLPEFSNVFAAALYTDGSVAAQLMGPTSRDLKRYEPGKTLYVQIEEDGTIRTYFQFQFRSGAFPTGPYFRLSDHGDRWVTLNSTVEGPDAGTFEITVERNLGDTVYSRHYPFASGPVPQTMVDSALAAREEMIAARRAQGAPPEALQLPPVEVPPMLPQAVEVYVGQEGSMWIRFRDTEAGRPYQVHDADGEPLGRIVIALNQWLVVASLDEVYVLDSDEFDVQSVVRYRLVRPESGP